MINKNKDFKYDTKYEITKQINELKTDFLIEIGLESKEKALTLVKIIYFVRKVLNKKFQGNSEILNDIKTIENKNEFDIDN